MERSGISPDLWRWVDSAGDSGVIGRINTNLIRNKLPATGIDFLKF
jgi:hypothetical protein